jgi:hypothetical protein
MGALEDQPIGMDIFPEDSEGDFVEGRNNITINARFTPIVGVIYATPQEGVDNSKYFYDNKNHVYRDRIKDRVAIINSLDIGRVGEKRKVADGIVENLIRYSENEKTLSEDGCNSLIDYWDRVQEYTTKSEGELEAAKSYISREQSRQILDNLEDTEDDEPIGLESYMQTINLEEKTVSTPRKTRFRKLKSLTSGLWSKLTRK